MIGIVLTTFLLTHSLTPFRCDASPLWSIILNHLKTHFHTIGTGILNGSELAQQLQLGMFTL